MAESIRIGDTRRSNQPLLERYARHDVVTHMVACLQRNTQWENWFLESSYTREPIRIGRKIAYVFYENGQEDLANKLQKLLLQQVQQGMKNTEDVTWTDLYLHVMNDLAITEMQLGQHLEALVRREEILKRSRFMGQFSHEYTLLWTSNLAKSYRAAHRFDEALILQQQVFESHRTSSTFHQSLIDHSQLVAVKDFAAALHANGRYIEARFWREFCLCKLRGLPQPNRFIDPYSWSEEIRESHLDDLECQLLLDLAMSYLDFGLELEAEKMCCIVYSTRARLLSEDHIDVLLTSERLSNIAWRSTQNHSSVRFWKCRLVERCAAKYGERDLRTLNFKRAYAEVLSKVDLETSIRLFQEVIHDQEQSFGKDSVHAMYTRGRLAKYLSTSVNPEQRREAVKIQKGVLIDSQASNGAAGSNDQLNDEEKLGDFLDRAGLHFDASIQYQRSLDLREQHSTAYTPFTEAPEIHPATL
ncbi:hypothetical protein ACHAPU_004662 [Fusarium lateritium]